MGRVRTSTKVLGALTLILLFIIAALYSAYTELAADYEELRRKYEHLAAEAAIEVVNDRDYYAVALELIESANESIYVIMFVVKYDPGDPDDPVNRLLWALGNASERGVKVAVIIEGETAETSQKAYDYLVRAGVNATWDPEGVRTHCKLVVVDRYLTLIGSHNWTESALSYNHETSVLIRSEEAAEEEIRYFNAVWAEAKGS